VLGVAIRTARAPPGAEGERAGPSGDDPPGPSRERALDLALRDLEPLRALDEESWDREVGGHRAWWASFWAVSSIRIPDREIEALWYRGLYQLASLSRPGKHPVSLQGVWTRDGGLPPWAGDYHLDVNVEESYWPAYASNHLDLALPLAERFLANLPRYRRMCREFFGFDGCYTRCEQALDGSEIFGYATTNFWAGNGAWLAHQFWLHWRYTLDFEFLARAAYPFLRSAMDLYLGLLEKEEDGYYHLPVTNSPEFHENLDSAWGKDDAGNLALIQFLAEALLEAERVLGREDPARERWRDVLANLAPLPGTTRDPATGKIRYRPNGQGGLLVMAGRPYDMPHRHMTHLLAIYPLCLLRKGIAPEIDLLVDDSIENVLRLNQPIGDWAGWTFPWVSLLASHTGRREVAVEMLRRFAAAHAYPNGLHENGDWRGLGTTRLRYRRPTVTVEGSIAAAAAVTDLLLQSDGGTLRLFPGCPEGWREASFSGLRAEGAFVVSARREGGRLAAVRIASEKGSRCRIAGLPPGTRARQEGGPEVAVEAREGALEFRTSAGAAYELLLPALERSEEAR
ncbi:MAG: glycosyl hydrolase family 95 catalytic domain-containing protein, partial [Planctomycetota bacterium]